MVSLYSLFFVLSSWVLLFMGHPPPSSTPLIENFSLSLSIHSSDRYLLVGSNSAGFNYNVRDALRAFTMGHGYAKCPQNLALSTILSQQLEGQNWENVNFFDIVL